MIKVPSKPNPPERECDRGIYITVRWIQPDDGGADITGYVIKYGDDKTDENNYPTEEIAGNRNDFQFTRQLVEDTKYQFAVAAVNKTGLGEFSDFCDYINTDTGKLWLFC